MIDRLSVLCFAGTYGLALVAELARFVVRGAVRWYLAAGLMALGWLVQTAFLANLALKSPMVLVTTAFESLMVLSWIVALIGLYLMVRSPRPVAVGMFVLPLVLGLVDRRGLVRAAGVGLARLGRHGRVLGDGARDFPAGRGGLHVRGVLRRADVPGRRCGGSRPSGRRRFGLALPSLEQSERINRGAITIAFPLLTFGLLIGMVLSLAARGEDPAAHGAHAAVDRSQGPQRAGDVAGLRGACSTRGSGRRCGAGA